MTPSSASYGYGPDTPVDLVWWNDPNTWRFAWQDIDLDGFLFVAGNWRGSQFAYRRDDLRAPGDPVAGDPSLWFAGSHGLEVKPLKDRRNGQPFRFGTWVTRVLATAELQPDPLEPSVRARFPEVPATHLLIAAPPPPVGDGSPGTLFPLPAATAMVTVGDVETQCNRLAPGQKVRCVRAVTDERGRARLLLEVAD